MSEQLLLPVERPRSVRQTLAAYLEACPRSAYLSLRHDGGPSSHAMDRGTVFHAVAERLTREALKTGEVEISGDVARSVAQEIIAERKDLVLPVHEQEACRLMAWNWGESFVVDHPAIFIVERKVKLDLGGWSIHGTIDLAEWLNPEGTEALITDYKTSLALPSQEQYERNFQAQFYALLINRGTFAPPEDEDEEPDELVGKRVAPGLSTVHTRQIFPRYRLRDGTLAQRYARFTQPQLADFAESLKAVLGKLDHGLEANEWPAIPGTHCWKCPVPQECPIPKTHRYIANIESPQDAAELAAYMDKLDSEKKRIWVSLREWAKENGPIFVGKDEVYDFTPSESRTFNKDRALAEVDNPEQYFDVRVSTRLTKTRRET